MNVNAARSALSDAPTGDDEARPVPGTVRIMAEDPVELPSDDAESVPQRLSAIVNRRPWLVPAVLLGAGLAYLLVRRRR